MRLSLPASNTTHASVFEQLSDGAPFKRSIGNPALMIFAVAEHPRFAERAFIRQGRGEKIGQTPAAPEPILIDRFEAQGIQQCLTHATSLYSRPSPTNS